MSRIQVRSFVILTKFLLNLCPVLIVLVLLFLVCSLSSYELTHSFLNTVGKYITRWATTRKVIQVKHRCWKGRASKPQNIKAIWDNLFGPRDINLMTSPNDLEYINYFMLLCVFFKVKMRIVNVWWKHLIFKDSIIYKVCFDVLLILLFR